MAGRNSAMFGAALLAVTLVAISLVANAAAAQPENGEARCESLHDVFGDSEAAPAIVGSAANSTADPVVDPVSPPEIALSYKGDPVEFKFGRTRDSKFDRVDVEIIASDFDIRGTEIKVEVIRPKSTKVDAAQDNSIGVKNIVVKARVDADKKSINLFVCVDPMVPTPSAPGNYKGGLVIKQPGFQRESVALDVNLQNRDKITPIIFFVGAVLAGGAFQWLVSGNLQGVSNGGTRIRGRLVTGSSVLELVFGVGAGAIAAMTTIFFSRYFNNPAWSGDFNELFLFSAAVAAAAAAAYPAAALLARGVTRQGGTTAENADKADTTKRNDDEPSGPG